MIHLTSFTIRELRWFARRYKIIGYSRMTKAALIEAIDVATGYTVRLSVHG